ncbi:UNKNOWN [Stylonychia lemnae]|uniref:Transmembrane protein n=1 Tax=Stylonychia lemnae TaxID=5949 RepID=A0A078AEK0_STYLE|nr:UNKNOWN [Stylonychia lemnae]|eukprot:CDW80699.1 UNKNOWN [Stylonychia lemnae]
MDSCFPNPEHTQIALNEQTIKHRKLLRYLFYGEFYIIFAKLLLMGFISALFQLFSLWIIYICWATLSYCNLIFFMFSAGLDFLILLNYINAIQLSPFFTQIIYYSMLVYFAVALVVSYRAYKCFKEQHSSQFGPISQGYSPFRNGMSQYDDENRVRSTNNNTYLYQAPQGARRQQTIDPQPTQPHRNQANYRAFQGQGTRIG